MGGLRRDRGAPCDLDVLPDARDERLRPVEPLLATDPPLEGDHEPTPVEVRPTGLSAPGEPAGGHRRVEQQMGLDGPGRAVEGGPPADVDDGGDTLRGGASVPVDPSPPSPGRTQQA
jgi:hypothetical protein